MTVQYLIDSENVGDFWIPLLELPADKTELIVFYTRNSPHMSYESLIRLKESDRTVTFIKCYEGTNALDFQLVSELGYLIGKEEDGSFVIVTNDTGFDAAVKYWRRKKKSVKRITGKECKNLERRLKEDLGESRSSRHRPLPEEYPPYEPEISGESGDGELHEDGSRPAEETEQRSSRPVLRDAESAALPDPEEDSCEESAEETADDLRDDEADFDGPSYEESDQEICDEELPFTARDDGSGPAEDQYAQAEEDASAGSGEYSEEGNGGEDGPGTEPETASASEEDRDGWDGSDGSEDLPPKSGAAREEDEKEEDHEELLSSDLSGQEPVDAGMNLSGTGAELSTEGSAEAGEDSPSGQKTGQPADETSESPEGPEGPKGPESPEDPESFAHGESDPDGQKMSAQKNAEEEASSGTEKEEKDDQVLSSESSESGHRSKSRRSRTRRSRSGSRKQDQSAEDEQSGGNDEKQRHLPSDQEESADIQPQPAGEKADQVPDDEEIARIVACIGADNLAELHNQLATFYGDQGKDIYLSIKSNSRSLPVLKPDLGQKFAYYCEIIFARSDYTGEYPADISEFLLNAREKLGNLNSLRYALIKHYGKEKGRRFYFLLKPFAKTMYQM